MRVDLRLLLLVMVFLVAAGDRVEARSLHWRELAVQARLDADGRLHVRERQVMVFSGDWNGGERRFYVGPGQRLEQVRIARIDPQTGVATPLRQGSLKQVDQVVTMQGMAQSNERVSEMLRNLTNNTPWFSKPELVEIIAANVSLSPKDQRRVASFNLRFQLVRSAGAQKTPDAAHEVVAGK